MIDFSHPYEPDPGVDLDTQDGKHRWVLDDRPAPGITEILSRSGWIPNWSDQEKMDDGSRVHILIANIVDGTHTEKDDEEFKAKYPHLAGRLESGKKAAAYFMCKPGWAEIYVCNRKLWVCTAIDAVGTLAGAVGTINWKGGVEEPWHSIQTAGESLLMFDDPLDLERQTFRASVYLSDDGSFDPARNVRVHQNQDDFKYFEAACVNAEGLVSKGYAKPEQRQGKKKAPPVKMPYFNEETSKIFTNQTEPKQGKGGLFG